MICNKCGFKMDPGDLFCIACGARVEFAEPQQDAQQPGAAYQPRYKGEYAYGEPPQPPRSKKFLFIGIGAALTLALAAVLISVFSAGTKNRLLSGSNDVNPPGASGMRVGITPSPPAVSEAPVMATMKPAPTEAPAVESAPAPLEIGIIVPNTDSDYFSALVNELQNYSEGYGFSEVTVLTTYGDAAVESEMLDMLLAQGVDGIIMATDSMQAVSDSASLPMMQSKAEDAVVPIIFISDFTEEPVNAVSRDYQAAAGTAVGNSAGSTYIIYPREWGDMANDMKAAAEDVLGNRTDIWLAGTDYCSFSEEDAGNITSNMFSAYGNVDSVVCLDPIGAPGVLDVLNVYNFTGNFICFTEEPIMKEMSPWEGSPSSITYVYFPVEDAVDTALSKLSSLINGYNDGSWPIMLEPYGF